MNLIKRFWLPAVGVLAYLYFARALWFIQDDAYITYRYVQNFLNGNGLVFNVGEQVEGITNFGWAIVQILAGALSLPYIAISQGLGLLFGAGMVVLTFLIGERLLGDKEPWFAGAAALLVGLTQSLAYWSVAGLETACFGFFSLLSFYFLISRNWLLIWSTVMMVWMRPEGAVVTALLIAIDSIRMRKISWFPIQTGIIAFVLSLPFVGFKLSYYGGILPNPFYAKTRADLEHFQAGFTYVWEFLRHYGFVGLGLLIPIVFWRKLSGWQQALVVYVVLYTLYIVSVGGDVLKVHRFFFPVFTGYAILALLSIQLLLGRLSHNSRALALFLCFLPMGFLTYYLPSKVVADFNMLERAFTKKMLSIAKEMKRTDDRPFSVALATIGIFGYELMGHDIIDMVGLTDSTIARHPEPPIPGMTTTWRERNLNTAYLLTRAPDYIVFSTGIKPSAPAERALMLYRQFTDSYRSVAWYYESQPGAGVLNSAFKKVRPLTGELTPYYPVEYVQNYKSGLDHYARLRYDSAIYYYDKALAESPYPPFVYILYNKAFSLLLMNQYNESMNLLDEVLAQDSLVYEAHKDLDILFRILGNTERSELHRKWLERLVPWYMTRHEQSAQEMLRQARIQLQQQQLMEQQVAPGNSPK